MNALTSERPLLYAGMVIAFITGFAINFSTSMQNIMVGILLFASLFSPQFKGDIKKALDNNFIRGAVLFYLLLIIGVIWSSAHVKDSVSMLTRMALYLLCPLAYVFFSPDYNKRWFFMGFTVSVVLSVFLSIISVLSGTGFFHPAIGIHIDISGFDLSMFRGHTYQNYFAGLISVVLLTLLVRGHFKERNHRLLMWTLLIVIFIDVFFFVSGRTGQILYTVMMAMAILFLFKKYRIHLLAGLLIIVLPLTLYFSNNIREGFARAQSDINRYKAGDANTSLGLRMTFYKNSLQLISQSPIYGHGTGSMRYEYEKLNDPVMQSVINPHNDYLWFGVELGIIGISFFLLFIVLCLKQSFMLHQPFNMWAIILITTYVVSTLQNSFFTDNLTGQFFILALCALMAAKEEPQHKSQ